MRCVHTHILRHVYIGIQTFLERHRKLLRVKIFSEWRSKVCSWSRACTCHFIIVDDVLIYHEHMLFLLFFKKQLLLASSYFQKFWKGCNSTIQNFKRPSSRLNGSYASWPSGVSSKSQKLCLSLVFYSHSLHIEHCNDSKFVQSFNL